MLLPILIYDGYCKFCTSLVKLLEKDFFRSKRSSNVQLIPFQKASLLKKKYNLSEESLRQSLHLISEKETVFRGVDALVELCQYFPLLKLGKFLFKSRFGNKAYTIISKNRYGFFGCNESCYVPTNLNSNKHGTQVSSKKMWFVCFCLIISSCYTKVGTNSNYFIKQKVYDRQAENYYYENLSEEEIALIERNIEENERHEVYGDLFVPYGYGLGTDESEYYNMPPQPQSSFMSASPEVISYYRSYFAQNPIYGYYGYHRPYYSPFYPYRNNYPYVYFDDFNNPYFNGDALFFDRLARSRYFRFYNAPRFIPHQNSQPSQVSDPNQNFQNIFIRGRRFYRSKRNSQQAISNTNTSPRLINSNNSSSTIKEKNYSPSRSTYNPSIKNSSSSSNVTRSSSINRSGSSAPGPPTRQIGRER